MAQNTTTPQTAQVSSTTSSSTPAVATPVVKAETYQVVVKAPADKGMLAYLVGPGAQIVLKDIDLNSSTISQEAGNLRITTKSGGEVLLLDFAAAAADSKTTVVTEDGTLSAQKLLAAVQSTQVANAEAQIEPAAGDQASGENGGITAPTILGTGVGSGVGIFSEVIGPFGLGIARDEIITREFPIEPGGAALPPVIGPVNNPPFARNDKFSTAVDKPVTMTPGQLLVNDTDPDGDPLTIVSVQGALHGTVQIVNGNVVFTPDAGFTGTGSYSYTITDGNGGTSTADVLIQIDPDPSNQNNVIAADDAYTVPESGRSIVMNVMSNDSDPEGDALVPSSVRIITPPSVGTATANADGTITYQSVPSNTDYFVTLVYELRDDKGAADTATVTIEVKATNTVDAIDDTGEIIPAGASKAFNVVANDIDPQNDAFAITSIVSGPAQGTATFNAATGTIVYHSVPSNVGYSVDIVYEITDARGAKDTATLHVRVEPTNNVSAVDDTADVVAGQDVRIDVLRNDFDQQGDAFNITAIVEQPRDSNGNPRGSVAINADGTITYTDTPGARDADVVEFKYSITDSKGAVDIAVVRVTIDTAINGVDANNDTLTMPENGPRTNITATLLANDFDAQNDTFQITAVGPLTVGQGTVELVGNQVFFTPGANYDGQVVFTYTITDSKGAQDTAQVLINIQEAQQTTLNAGDDNFSTPFNTNLTITPAQVLANDFDPDGSVLTGSSIISFTQPLNGAVTQLPDGSFVYNPNDTFRGTDSFTYTIRDAQGDEDTATITIRVADPEPQDNPVDAVDDTMSLAPRETKFINVLNNDSAPDGGLQFVRVVGALPAGVTDHGNGIFSYTAPATAPANPITFQYEVRDIDGDTDIATVTIRVEGPGNNVIANDDTVTLVRNTANNAVDSIVINVEANDTDPQGDAFDTTLNFTQPAIGSVTRNADGSFTYTADASVKGAYTTTFTYEIRDALGATDTAVVTINVGEDFNSVIANDDAVTLVRNTANNAVDSIVINVEANDVDPQGDAFDTTLNFTQPAIGSVTRNADGSFTYTADAAVTGAYTTTFTYEIRDALGATDTAVVTINVGADFNNVIANDDTVTLVRNTANNAVDTIVINVEANDTDPQGDSFDTTLNFTQPAIGSVTRNADGSFTYTADASRAGAYTTTFTYEIRDTRGAVDTAVVTINVGADYVNTVDARDDTVTLVRNTANNAVDTIVIDVEANDVDAEGDAFDTTTNFTQPAIGSVARNANGSFTYTADASVTGAYTTTFTYEIRDARGATDTAVVTINVGADYVNTVDARDDSVTLVRNTANNAVDTIRIDVEANDVDAEGDAFDTTTNFTQPGIGSVVRNADGSFTYTADASRTGAYDTTFTYEIRDARGATDTATVTIHVGKDFEVPNTVDARDDSVTLVRNTANNAVDTIRIDVEANDVDPQGDAFDTTTNFTQPAIGSVARNADGSFTYTADASRAGAYTTTFTYEIRDARGATDTATVTVNVGADFVQNTVVAVNDYYTLIQGGSLEVPYLSNDYDPQGDAFAPISIVPNNYGSTFAGMMYPTFGGPPLYGTSYMTGGGNVIFVANDNRVFITALNGNVTESFTYTIRDTKGATSTATAYITIPAPPPPAGDGWSGDWGGGGGEGDGGGCPLVVDLDQNGISLLSREQSSATFDWTPGERTNTAWFDASEAILARDYSGNGTIDGILEVFGTGRGASNGFDDLRNMEDSNKDGIINAEDAGWSALRVWVDANTDGIGQASELRTLDEVGIKSFNLNAELHNTVHYQDASMPFTGSVEMADGSTRQVHDVYFGNTEGAITGTSANDVLIFSATADSIDGGQGLDTLKVLTSSEISISSAKADGVETIDMDNNGADKLTINIADVLDIADNGVLAVRGDSVDEVSINGEYTQGANVQQAGTTFASYTASNGAQLLVELGVTVNTDPNHHG